jgi:hypothetical protein
MSATVKFSSIIVCNHASWAVFEVLNTSSLWIKSTNSALQESGSHRDLGATKVNRPFLQAPQGCPPGVSDLKAGSLGYIAAKLAPSVNVNDNIDATITLCSEPDRGGICSTVPVQFTIPAAMPPPPGPPPDNQAVQVNFSNIHDCSNKATAVFEVVNNGNTDLNSIQAVMKNMDTGEHLMSAYLVAHPFLSARDGCPPPPTNLQAGRTGFAYIGFDRNKVTNGQRIEATIDFYSEEEMAGIRTTVLVQFTYNEL